MSPALRSFEHSTQMPVCLHGKSTAGFFRTLVQTMQSVLPSRMVDMLALLATADWHTLQAFSSLAHSWHMEM